MVIPAGLEEGFSKSFYKHFSSLERCRELALEAQLNVLYGTFWLGMRVLGPLPVLGSWPKISLHA